MKKRLLSWLLVLTMVISLIPSTLVTTAFAADVSGITQELTFDAADSEKTLNADGGYILKGSLSGKVIKVTGSAKVKLYLQGVTMTADTSPIQVENGSKLTLVVADDTTNTITCTATAADTTNNGMTAGIHVPDGATLTIDTPENSQGTGKLSVTGGYGGAGIGGGAAVGQSTTKNAMVAANGTKAQDAVGYINNQPIGRTFGGQGGVGGESGLNGANAESAGTVNIKNGVLTVIGGTGGAGIGGGMGAAGSIGKSGKEGSKGENGISVNRYVNSAYTIQGIGGAGGGGGGQGGIGGVGGTGGAGAALNIENGSLTITAGEGAAAIGGGAGGVGGKGTTGGNGGNGGNNITISYGGASLNPGTGGGGQGGQGGTGGSGGTGGAGGSVNITGGIITLSSTDSTAIGGSRGGVGGAGGQGGNGGQGHGPHHYNGKAGAAGKGGAGGSGGVGASLSISGGVITANSAAAANDIGGGVAGANGAEGTAGQAGAVVGTMPVSAGQNGWTLWCWGATDGGAAGASNPAYNQTNGAGNNVVIDGTQDANIWTGVAVDSTQASIANRPKDKNGNDLYLYTLTVKQLDNQASVSDAKLVLKNVKGTSGAAYNYTAVSNANGEVQLWLPQGEYTLAGKDVSHKTEGWIPDSGKFTFTVEARDNQAGTVKIGANFTLTASTKKKVYFSDDEKPVTLTVDATSIIRDIVSVKWFVEPIAGTVNQYDAKADTTNNIKEFDTDGYNNATDRNRKETLVTGQDHTFTIPVNENGRYWVQVSYKTGSGDVVAKVVNTVTVTNIYRKYPIQVNSYTLEKGVHVGETGYEALKTAGGEVYTADYGFAWDLNGYDANALNGSNLLAENVAAYDTVPLAPKSTFAAWYLAHLLSNSEEFVKNTNASGSGYQAITMTLNPSFLSETENKRCDTVDGKKDFSKYTIVYAPRDGSLTAVTVSGVDEDATDGSTLYSNPRSYTEAITFDTMVAQPVKGYKLTGAKIILANGTEKTVSPTKQENGSYAIQLTNIHGTVANQYKDKVAEVKFIYKNNMTDVTVKAMYNKKELQSYTTSLEKGITATITAPSVTGYTADAPSKTVKPGDDPAANTVTFTYTKDNGNVTVVAVDANGSKELYRKDGGTVARGTNIVLTGKAEAPTIEYYTTPTAPKSVMVGSTEVKDLTNYTYDGVGDIIVTYEYTRKTQNVTIIKKNVDTGAKIEDQTLENLPVGKSHTFADGSVKVPGDYQAVADRNPTSYFVEDKANQTVTFYYKNTSADQYTQVTVNLICDGKVFQSYPVTAIKGQLTTILAPTWNGYTFAGTEQDKVKTVTPNGTPDNDKVEFEYTITNPKTVTVVLKDNSNSTNPNLKAPANYISDYKLKMGDNVTIWAPAIDGYSLVSATLGDKASDNKQMVQAEYSKLADGTTTVTFAYMPVSQADFVKHTVNFVLTLHDGKTETLYTHEKLIPKGTGNQVVYKEDDVQYTVPGYAYEGISYNVDGGGNKATDVKDNVNATITYRFTEAAAWIEIIQKCNGNGTANPAHNATQTLTGYREGQKNVVIIAPVLKDHALKSDQDMSYTFPELATGKNEHTFQYELAGNITFTLMEKGTDGTADRIIAVLNGDSSKTYNAKDTTGDSPLNLTALGYTYIEDANASTEFKPNGPGQVTDLTKSGKYTVYYKKMTRKVEFVAVDKTELDKANKKLDDVIKDGTVSKYTISGLKPVTPEDVRVGESYKAVAQSFDGWALKDDYSKYYEVPVGTDPLKVYFMYVPKTTGTVTVHYHFGTADDKGEKLNVYTITAVAGENLKISAPEYLLNNKYHLRAGQQNPYHLTVTQSPETVDFYYEANFVTVTTKVNLDGTDSVTHETYEVIKDTTTHSGSTTLYPPEKAGYTLIGITATDATLTNGGADQLPTEYADNKLALTGLATDATVTYYYKTTKASEYQTKLTVEYKYNGYDLAADKTINANTGEANPIDIPAFDGYTASTYIFKDGSGADTTSGINGPSVTVNPKEKTATLTITYTRPDGSIVLPGKGDKIGDGNDIIVKPTDPNTPPTFNPDNGSVTIPKDPAGNTGTVTRPKDPTKPADGKEDIIVPGGTTIDKDGTIHLPDGGGTITPDNKLPGATPTGYISVVYKANGGTGDDVIDLIKNGQPINARTSPFTNGNQTFTGWNTADNGVGGTAYQRGDEITIPNSGNTITLYAQWGKANFAHSTTITYLPNDGTGDTNKKVVTVGSNTDANFKANLLDTNPFSVPGWTFGGWHTASNGAGSEPKQLGAEIDATAGTPQTWYAQWYRVNEDDSITVPGEDGNPNTPDNNVTANGNGTKNPERKDNGEVDIPAGGNVVKGNGETIALPNGGTLKPDGTLIINKPNNGGQIGVKPDGSTDNADVVVLTYVAYNGTNDTRKVYATKGDAIAPLAANTFSYSGHSFLYWQSGNDTYTAAAGTITPTEAMTLFAVWAKANPDGSVELPGQNGKLPAPNHGDNVTVTPNPDGSVNPTPDGSGDVKVDGGGTVTRPDPSDPNHPNGKKEDIKVPDGTIVKPNGTIILPEPKPNGTTINPGDKFPDTTADYVTVTLLAGTGTGNTIKKVVTTGSTVILTDENRFTAPAGEFLVGWQASDGRFFDPDDSYTANTAETFTAQYKANAELTKAVAVFDYAGGVDTQGNGSKSITGKATTAIPNSDVPMPTRDGYTFNGWDKQPLNFGEIGTVTVFTAQWSKQTYTVTFKEGTDGTMTGDAAAQVDYNGSVPADKIPNVTENAGKVFIGWLNGSDNSVYTAESLANYKVTGNVTFTAKYANASDAIVIFDYDGGTAEGKYSSYRTGTPDSKIVDTGAIPTPTRPGFTFTGWDKTIDENTVFGTAGTVTVYKAGWNPDTKQTFTVTFDIDATKGNTTDATTEQVEDGSFVTNVPTVTAIPGYSFVGWKDPNGKLFYEAGIQHYRITGETTFTAEFVEISVTPDKATVSFDANGGRIGGSSVLTQDGIPGTVIGVPAEPVRPGYTFMGWSDGFNATTTYGAKGTSVTYTAQWQAIAYTIHFSATGASGATADQTYQFDGTTSNTLNRNGFSMSGKRFLGWSLTDGASTADYADGALINTTLQNAMANSNGSITLYAVWKDNGSTGDGSSGGGSIGGGGGGGGGSSTVSSYTIKASAGNGGIISPSGNVSVKRGEDQSFHINPINGYRISDVIVDGKSVGAVSTYTFDSVKANHTIEVKFTKLNSIVADPEVTGVAGWLQTKEHNGYMGGYGNGLFGPNDNMTRAQAAQMFYNLLLNKDVDITVNFTDVPADAWYGNAVRTLASLGVIKGIGNGQFAPNRTITRAEFTVIAMRFANVSADVTNPFTDIATNDWYYTAVTSAVSYGWITGYSDGSFRPQATITRAEVVTIVNRMLNRTADRNFVDSNVTAQFDDVPNTYWAYYNIMEATIAHDHSIDNDGVESWGKQK